jgi:hypothetical protein
MLVGHAVIEQYADRFGLPRGTIDGRSAPRRQRRTVVGAKDAFFQKGHGHFVEL